MEKVLFTRQRHEADKAGPHHDYRMVIGDKAYSWATKKSMPDPGQSIMLWEQPVHTREYALSKRVVIPKGQYGSGVTTLDWVKKSKASLKDNEITIDTGDTRFLLKKMPKYGDGTGWLFKNLGPIRGQQEMQKKTELLQKVAVTIQRYTCAKTGKTMWHVEGTPLPKGEWIKDIGVGKHITKGSGNKYLKKIATLIKYTKPLKNPPLTPNDLVSVTNTKLHEGQQGSNPLSYVPNRNIYPAPDNDEWTLD